MSKICAGIYTFDTPLHREYLAARISRRIKDIQYDRYCQILNPPPAQDPSSSTFRQIGEIVKDSFFGTGRKKRKAEPLPPVKMVRKNQYDPITDEKTAELNLTHFAADQREACLRVMHDAQLPHDILDDHEMFYILNGIWPENPVKKLTGSGHSIVDALKSITYDLPANSIIRKLASQPQEIDFLIDDLLSRVTQIQNSRYIANKAEFEKNLGGPAKPQNMSDTFILDDTQMKRDFRNALLDQMKALDFKLTSLTKAEQNQW